MTLVASFVELNCTSDPVRDRAAAGERLVHDAEQRDVGTDAEREAENGDEGEPWRLEQLPGGVAEHGHQPQSEPRPCLVKHQR